MVDWGEAMDATQQILAAYSGVIAGLLDRLVEKRVLEQAEVQDVLKQVAQRTSELHPHGLQVITALRSAVDLGESLRTSKRQVGSGAQLA